MLWNKTYTHFNLFLAQLDWICKIHLGQALRFILITYIFEMTDPRSTCIFKSETTFVEKQSNYVHIQLINVEMHCLVPTCIVIFCGKMQLIIKIYLTDTWWLLVFSIAFKIREKK